MKGIEWLKADPGILAGLIGKVWATDPTEQDDALARSNAELFIRMSLEETTGLNRTHGTTVSVTDEEKKSY